MSTSMSAAHQPVALNSSANPCEHHGIIEIRDPEIDVQDIMARIRRNRQRRQVIPLSSAALGRARMAKRRKQIMISLKELQSRIRDYGVVESHKQGFAARLDLFFKRFIRKLIQRHILQQHRLHLKLHTVLGQLVQYLEAEDVSLRTCIDHAENQWRAVERPRKRKKRTTTGRAVSNGCATRVGESTSDFR
jgi:hypothetical protein